MRTAIFALALISLTWLTSLPFRGFFSQEPPCTATVLTVADRMGEVCYEFSKNPSGRESDGVTTFARACRREIESYRSQRGSCK